MHKFSSFQRKIQTKTQLFSNIQPLTNIYLITGEEQCDQLIGGKSKYLNNPIHAYTHNLQILR